MRVGGKGRLLGRRKRAESDGVVRRRKELGMGARRIGGASLRKAV
jgi:hypothetical protein